MSEGGGGGQDVSGEGGRDVREECVGEGVGIYETVLACRSCAEAVLAEESVAA